MKAELFSNGNDFLKEYNAKDQRKIILDYDFNGRPDGLKILQSIKKINPAAVVIMVSSQDNLETAIETMRKGASDYFLKTNKTVFVNIVSSLLKLIEMERYKMN
jgi:DNA-binding NtrC family response regulator